MRHRTTTRRSSILAASAIATIAMTAGPAAARDLNLVRVGAGGSPMLVTQPRTGGPLFVAQRSGAVQRLLPSGSFSTVFTIPGVIQSGEGGLLGLAPHPDFATNGLIYVNVTTSNGGVNVFGRVSPFSTRIWEYQLTTDGTALVSGPRQLLEIPQPFSNHNAGWVGFGPDGFLYIAVGDGGSGGDPFDLAQNTGNLFGTMLRIDVEGDDFPGDPDRNYAIPPSNPFVDAAGEDEIFSYGLRNPYRNSFDRVRGDLWIGDVGQNLWEEVSVIPAGSPGGENFGWNEREGFNTFEGPRPAGNVDPVYEYAHGFGEFEGNSIVGGHVYRGPVTSLRGKYIFGDSVSDSLWLFDPADPFGTVERLNPVTTLGSVNFPVSFGEDAAGNLYLTDFSGGEIFRVTGEVGCFADLTFDGALDVFDILRYFAAFAAPTGGFGDPTTAGGFGPAASQAELTGDGVRDVFDILSYFDLFAAGC